MSQGGAGLHLKIKRVLRAQSHGPSKALDRNLRLTNDDVRPAAEDQCPCQVWVEGQSPVGKSDAVIEVTDNKREGYPGRPKRNCVIPAQLGGSPSQPRCFGHLFRTVDYPARCL